MTIPVIDFGALPPEVNSGRLYLGPGSGPMLAAATAWDGLAAELGSAASAYKSVISGLTSDEWTGPASESMAGAAAPYVAWMSTSAARAEQTATQARAAAAAYETAFAATVPPPVIAANRAQLQALVATNFFGQNSPAIAATEAEYGEMWAQDAAAMYGYAGASSSAATVTPFETPPQTIKLDGQVAQSDAVAKAAATPAGNSAQTAMAAMQPVSSAAATTTTPTAATTATPAATTTAATTTTTTAAATTTTTTTTATDPLTWLDQQISGLTTANRTTLLKQINGDLGYFPLGITQFNASIAQQLVPGTPSGAGAAGSSPLAPGGWGSFGGGFGGGAPVSGGVGQAGTIGRLSVPSTWAAATPQVSPSPTSGPVAVTSISAQPHSSGPGGLLRGIPLNGAGRRSGGFIHKYGFRHTIMPRPPAAG